MTDTISGNNVAVGSVECKIIKVRTHNRKINFASLFTPKSLAFISIEVDNIQEIYYSNTVTYSSNIIFNFSKTINFNSESTILFSFYHQLNSESSISVACTSVTSQTLKMECYNSLTTSIKKRLEMFPVNSSNPNSYYCSIVIKFSGFVKTDISEVLPHTYNISHESVIDSTHSEHIPDLHTTVTQPSINLVSDNTNHNQYSQLLPHKWEKPIDGQVREYYVDHNTSITNWQHPDMITDEKYRRINIVFNTGWNVTSENYNSSFLYKNLNIKAGTITLVLQTRKGLVIKIIDKYFGLIPQGWEIRMDIATNLTYFADHISKKAFDYNPRFQNFFNIGSSLPENWGIRQAPDQLHFFVNHNPPRNTKCIDSRVGFDLYPNGRNFIKRVRNTRKKNIFFQKLCDTRRNPKFIKFTLTRENILEDSFCQIMGVKSTCLHRRLSFSFHGEKGLDFGGVTREWFYLISLEISNPMFCLFKTCTSENYSTQINPNSFVNPDHLLYFRFVGRLLAMALFHRSFIDGGFDINFYKQILGHRRTMEDLKMADIVIYNSLKWICENDIEKEDLELYFCTEFDLFGKMIVTELIPGGKEVRVTQSNKLDYVSRITEWTLNANTSEQMNAIKTAFFEIIPWSWVAFFDEKELKLLLCGMKSYDIKDWRNNTEYGCGYCHKSKQIKWFWTLVESFEQEQIARLLQFATGTRHVPFTGFCDLYAGSCPQKFHIIKWGATTHLPETHTCINQIKLPPYHTFDDLKSKLLTAIEESSGFDQF